MSDHSFDTLSKLAATAATRRQMLRGLAAALGGALLAAVGGNAFAAAPQICVNCTCGVGRPCNPKDQVCTTTRGFPSPTQACQAACQQHGQFFCGGAEQFHCPKGCP